MNDPKIQDIIDEVMDNFDFHKVHRVMKALNWRWVGATTTSKIPDIPHIRREVRKLIKGVIEDEIDFAFVGGFEVTNDHQGAITVKFVAEEMLVYTHGLKI